MTLEFASIRMTTAAKFPWGKRKILGYTWLQFYYCSAQLRLRQTYGNNHSAYAITSDKQRIEGNFSFLYFKYDILS